MITKDGRDTAIENLTPENYLVPKGEEMTYHCVIEVVQYDNKTGQKISRPRVQKFGKKMFESIVRDSLMKQGYEIKVLYNPNDYIKSQKAKAAEDAKAKKQAEQEKFDAAVAAAVAKALAEKEAADKAKAEAAADPAPKPGRKPKDEK